MPSVPDTSHLPWWLGPSDTPYNAMIKGIQAGSMIRSNQIRTQQVMAENEQNLQRQETNTQLKLMDLSLEKDRNELSKKSFQVKQDAIMLQKEGMVKIGDYMGNAIKDGKLLDPETQAGFWKLTSQYAPFIKENDVNSMWDNNFGAAMTRNEKAGKIGSEHTLIAYDKYAKDLEDQASQIEGLYPDDEQQLAEAKSLRDRASAIRSGSHMTVPGSGEIKTGMMTFGDQQVPYYMDTKGNPHVVKPPHDNMSDFMKMEYANELAVLKYKFEKEAFAPSEKLTKNESDSVTYDRLFKQLNQKYAGKASPSKTGEPAPSAATMKYDPTTDSLIPIK